MEQKNYSDIRKQLKSQYKILIQYDCKDSNNRQYNNSLYLKIINCPNIRNICNSD